MYKYNTYVLEGMCVGGRDLLLHSYSYSSSNMEY